MLRRAALLLRADLAYQKKTYLIWYILLLLLLIPTAFGAESSAYTVMVPFTFGFVVLFAVAGHLYVTFREIASERSEQRLRHLLPLPVTRRDIAAVRIGRIALQHAATLLLFALWLYLFMDVTRLDAGFSARSVDRLSFVEVLAVKSLFVQVTFAWLTLSAALCLLARVLESRRRRPLLSAKQWLIFLLLFAIIPLILFSGASRSLMGWLVDDLHLRGFGFWPRRGNGAVMIAYAGLPLFLFAAALLAYEYYHRLTRMDGFRE